jgi:hypothetical protein
MEKEDRCFPIERDVDSDLTGGTYYLEVTPDPSWKPDALCLRCKLSLPCFTECWGIWAFTTEADFFADYGADPPPRPIVTRMHHDGSPTVDSVPTNCQKLRAAQDIKAARLAKKRR